MNQTQWADLNDIPEVVGKPARSTTSSATGAEEEKPKLPPPEAVGIGLLQTPAVNDPNELLKHRYLCRGGGMLLVGPAGVGKSTLQMQASLCWGIGREFFGIHPARPLKSLLIQSENDHGDLAEMRDGVLDGLAFSPEERAAACANLLVATEDMRTAQEFCDQVVEPLVALHKPDLLWIDPALAYLGGETNSQKDVGAFLRNGLNPIVHRHQCGVIILHHTNKPPSGAEKPKWNGSEFAYLGSGSAEWANWPRAVLGLRSIGGHDIFELHAGKRGSRLKWEDADGERSYIKVIGHSTSRQYWREVPQSELDAAREKPDAEARFGRHKPTMEEFLKLFPTSFKKEPREALLSGDQVKVAFLKLGWHRDLYKGMYEQAEADGLLAIVRGEGRGGQLLRGLPEIVAAYTARREEAGSLMEQVPLKVCAKRRKPPKRR